MHAWQWCMSVPLHSSELETDSTVMLIEGALSIAVAVAAFFLLPNWCM